MHTVASTDANVPTLIVASAVHGAIRMALPPQMSIGRAVSSDLVLADPSIAATHMRFVTGTTVDIEAVESPILFDDGQSLAPGQVRTVDLSCSFQAGTVAMSLEMPRLILVAGPTPSRNAKGWIVLAVLAVVSAGSAAYAMTNHAAPALPAVVASDTLHKAGRDTAEVRRAILGGLESRHLPTISLEALADGSHRASGTIAPHEAVAWHDAKLWVDATFGGSVVLIDTVAIAAKAPPLSIQSAWLGDVPYVIEGSGEKLFTGAMLADGWVIDGIEAGRVLLKRQNQRIVVRF